MSDSATPVSADSGNAPVRSLSLLDSVCIIVGTIIGAGIFGTTPDVAANTSGASQLLWIWVLGGFIAMTGALCFAELMTRHSGEIGGDYVYLKKAFGRPVGFLFAWAAFWIIRPGNIGAMAMIFAQYFTQLAGGGTTGKFAYALLAVIVLSVTNLIGLRTGKVVQNVLTIAKVAGIALIVLLALITSPEIAESASTTIESAGTGSSTAPPTNLFLAMVMVMFTYGGWNDIAFVAGEVRKPKVNLLRSIVLGTIVVTIVYVAINWAFLHMLGHAAMSTSGAVATDFTQTALGADTTWGTRSSQLVAALICISCLGAINGMILTSPRIYYSVGRDFDALSFLARLNQRKDAPWQAIVLQTAVTLALILLCLRYADAFKVILIVTAPYFWGFLGATVLTLLVFRYGRGDNHDKDSGSSSEPDSIFRVPLFPLPALFFAGVCGAMVYSSVQYIGFMGYQTVAYIILGIMIVGVVAAFGLVKTDKQRVG